MRHVVRLEHRAIVLEHGNPSMKSQIKQLAAVESKFLLLIFSFSVYFLPVEDYSGNYVFS